MAKLKVELLNGEGFTFSTDGKSAVCEVDAVNPDEALLDILEAKNFVLPFGCRAGTCGSCRIQVLSGMEALSDVGPMEQDTLSRCRDEKSVRLSCRAKVKPESQGNLVIQIAAPVDPAAFEDS